MTNFPEGNFSMFQENLHGGCTTLRHFLWGMVTESWKFQGVNINKRKGSEIPRAP